MRFASPASPTIPSAAPNNAADTDCSSPVFGSPGAGGVVGVGGVVGGVGGVVGGVGGVGGVVGGVGGVGGVVGGVGGVLGGVVGGVVGGITVLLNSVSSGNLVVATNTLPSLFTTIPTVATILS